MNPADPCPFYTGQSYDYKSSIGHRLFLITSMMRREVDARMTAHGLTDAQWKPLWILRDGRATTAFELAREMAVDAGAITRLLDRLETKGLVERTRSQSDRRVVQLKLTTAGEAAADEVPDVLAAANNDFLRGFSAAEWQQLCGLIDRVVANGQALQAERQ